MKRTILLLLAALPLIAFSQNVTVNIVLKATEGGAHSNMQVTLVDTVTKATYKGKSDADGKAVISVPPNAVYDLVVPNYTRRKLVSIPNAPGASMTSTIIYSRDMLAEEKAFAMDDAEKAEVDRFAMSLPDTTWFSSARSGELAATIYYARIELQLFDFDKQPIQGEVVTLIGRKRKKAFKGTTGADGKIVLQLPKGDNYDLSFKYHRNFEFTECVYSKGFSEMQWSFTYIGSRKYEQLKREEEERLAEEKKRLEKEREEFLAFCKAHHVSEEEGRKLELETYMGKGHDDIVEKVMTRNQFKNPLIFCDVTGSMSPYMAQLRLWFIANSKTNPTSQFVFFNDGDGKLDSQKKTGETGGIYYSPAVTSDSLLASMSYASSRGSGGDCPENNMEALIKGVKLAKKPFTDIVMIADNNAPVKDISLLPGFNRPVHIICCGGNGNYVHPHYLLIAWKTKGSVHTAGADYNNIGNLKDGETIRIGTTDYRLMKGEFIPL
jgi:hypothetical protein